MPLTSAQLTALKADINNNSTQITVGGVLIAIKDIPNTPDNNFDIRDWYNGIASPDYWIWRSEMRRAEIYTATPAEATAWDWVGFKNQGVPEQNAWFEMFMGGTCNFGNANNRAGALAIFGTAGAGGANRTHIFNSVRRLVRRIEKLLAVAVLNPPANTGNNAAQPRGSAANPDVFGYEGTVTADEVTAARNLP